MAADAHRGALQHVAHKTAAEDVAAVDGFQFHIGGAHRTISAAAKHATAENAARTDNVRIADHFS